MGKGGGVSLRSTEEDHKEGHSSMECPSRFQCVHDNIRKGCGGPLWDLCHRFLFLVGGPGPMLEEAIDVPV